MNFRKLFPRLALGIAIIGAIAWAIFNRSVFDPASLDAWLKSFGVFGPVIYVLVFALGTIAFVPGSLFALAGGVLFGPIWGSVLNLLGATLGASLAFLVARYLGGSWVLRKTEGSFNRVVSGIEAEGWRFIALVRLVPIFPFNITNYALGLTRIGFLPYVITSFICMAPGAVAFTWLGYAGREAVNGNGASIKYALLALGLLAVIAFLPRLFKRITPMETFWINADDLDRQIKSDKSLTIIDVRGRDEFDGPLGHIPNALNIPLGDLPDNLTQINARKSQPVILICKTDKRSARAATLLREAGVQYAQVLRGGMEVWNRSGFDAVKTGANK
jgi:uncharacterized membrane protein YdjX (TVP38/TMEM64 family)/rhodanese-related sulfurtransferase